MPTSVTCDTCQGSGLLPGSKPVTCRTCAGMGRVRKQQGFFAIESTCPTCHGRGQIIENPCYRCAGSGRVTRERSLSINVPAGVEDGTRIRLSGEGEAGLRGGGPGDLYIFLAIKPHLFFSAMALRPHWLPGADLHGSGLARRRVLCAHPGRRRRQSAHPGGDAMGRQLKMRGKGMPILKSRDFGDLYIQAVVETPQNLTRRQRELLAEFEAESSHKTHPESTGFLADDEGILRRVGMSR